MVPVILTCLFYILTCGILNNSRGQDFISRTSFLGMIFLLNYVTFLDPILAVIITVGVYGWLSKSWGVYFTAFNGSYNTYINRYSRGVKFIHKITDKLIKVNQSPYSTDDARNWGTLGMALRGFFFSIPLFVMLAYYFNNPYITLLSIPMLLQGVYYRYVDQLYKFKYAEIFTANTWAILILISYFIKV